jgi:type I restriction enzyme S subunit
MFAINAPQTRTKIAAFQSGSTRKRISKGNLSTIPVPVPLRAEQDRVVAEIEKHFTRLDDAVATLERVQASLKRARASVLKAAVEGRLVPTEAELARGEGRTYEPASVLLERILADRKRKHEEAHGKKKYKPPFEPDAEGLRELPEGWFRATVDQLALSVQYGTSAKCSSDDLGVPVLRMGNIVDGRLVYEGLKYLPQDHDEFPDQLLQPGEVLFNRTNSPELVGKTAVFGGYTRPVACASYLIRVRLSPEIQPGFLSHLINSSQGRAWVRSVVTQQVGQANVNGTKLRNYLVPVPPAAEQTRIIAEVERRLSVFDALEQIVKRNLARCTGLRQSILARAFSGKLVSQDANDEPASALLARIQSQSA